MTRERGRERKREKRKGSVEYTFIESCLSCLNCVWAHSFSFFIQNSTNTWLLLRGQNVMKSHFEINVLTLRRYFIWFLIFVVYDFFSLPLSLSLSSSSFYAQVQTYLNTQNLLEHLIFGLKKQKKCFLLSRKISMRVSFNRLKTALVLKEKVEPKSNVIWFDA